MDKERHFNAFDGLCSLEDGRFLVFVRAITFSHVVDWLKAVNEMFLTCPTVVAQISHKKPSASLTSQFEPDSESLMAFSLTDPQADRRRSGGLPHKNKLF